MAACGLQSMARIEVVKSGIMQSAQVGLLLRLLPPDEAAARSPLLSLLRLLQKNPQVSAGLRDCTLPSRLRFRVDLLL